MYNYCEKCGYKVKPNSNFCINCGFKFNKDDWDEQPDNEQDMPLKEDIQETRIPLDIKSDEDNIQTLNEEEKEDLSDNKTQEETTDEEDSKQTNYVDDSIQTDNENDTKNEDIQDKDIPFEIKPNNENSALNKEQEENISNEEISENVNEETSEPLINDDMPETKNDFKDENDEKYIDDMLITEQIPNNEIREETVNNVNPEKELENNEDIKIFLNNLEQANPVLPPTFFNTMNKFDRDERGIYLLNNITIKAKDSSINPNVYYGLLVITNKRFYLDINPIFQIFHNEIRSMEYLDDVLIVTRNNEDYIIEGIKNNPLSFNIGDRHYDTKFTPHMLFNLIKGQVLG